MLSKRKPFRVGQVVASRFKPVTFHKLTAVSADGDSVTYRTEHGIHHYGNARSYFRPLTKKERA